MSFTNLELVSFMEDTDQISPQLAYAIRSGNTTSVIGNQAMTNAFVDLINKVIMVRARGITTINRWRTFYKERIPFGSGIEYVTIGQAKDKSTNKFAINATPGSDYGAMTVKQKPEMTNRQRITELSTTRYAVTLGNDWISYAVSNEFGISDVTAEFMRANERALEIDTDTEFKVFITEGVQSGGLTNQYIKNGVFSVLGGVDTSPENARMVLRDINNLSSKLATENTTDFTDEITRNLPVEDQVLIIDRYVYNCLKTQAYSGAFNLADLRIPIENIVLVDFGMENYVKSGNEDGVVNVGAYEDEGNALLYFIIADRNHYMIHDKKYKTTVEYVASSDTTNIYLFVNRYFYETFGQPITGGFTI